jgi:tetratricopeptide (TPR) repeat protein
MTSKRTSHYTLAMSATADQFNNAIQLQQNQKYDEALTAYHNLLDQSPLTPEQGSVISQNMALIYKNLNQLPLSYVYNKKALFLNGSNDVAIAFAKAELSQYRPGEVARTLSVSEQINSMGLKFIPIEVLFIGILLTTAFIFQILFRYLIEKKKALIQNKRAPEISSKLYLHGLLLILFTGFLYVKFDISSSKQGLLKVSSAEVSVAPGEKQARLIEINSGQALQILQLKEVDGAKYAQVKVPGAFSGWIKADQIEFLNLN